MAWHKKYTDLYIQDIRRIGSFKSFCRKCACHHPLDSDLTGMLKGCICTLSKPKGTCGLYVPTDNLEFLEYVSIMMEVDTDEKTS